MTGKFRRLRLLQHSIEGFNLESWWGQRSNVYTRQADLDLCEQKRCELSNVVSRCGWVILCQKIERCYRSSSHRHNSSSSVGIVMQARTGNRLWERKHAWAQMTWIDMVILSNFKSLDVALRPTLDCPGINSCLCEHTWADLRCLAVRPLFLSFSLFSPPLSLSLFLSLFLSSIHSIPYCSSLFLILFLLVISQLTRVLWDELMPQLEQPPKASAQVARLWSEPQLCLCRYSMTYSSYIHMRVHTYTQTIT